MFAKLKSWWQERQRLEKEWRHRQRVIIDRLRRITDLEEQFLEAIKAGDLEKCKVLQKEVDKIPCPMCGITSAQVQRATE